MKLHSRNRKRKLDIFNQSSDQVSCSLPEDNYSTSAVNLTQNKRFRGNNPSYSQQSEDDELRVLP